MSRDFSLDSYTVLVGNLLDRGYAAVSFQEADPAVQHLILRHDIDMSVAAALSMAAREAEMGVASTYFVLLRTELYNPWSADARTDLRAIAGLGHEIGLHFDASLYADDAASLEAAAAEECVVLESLTGSPVKTISFHRPAKSLQGLAGALAGRRHAYEPRFFTEMGYCSDSRGAWHHGAPLDHPAVAAGTALQLLTHPIWWVGDAAEPEDRLRRLLAAREAALDEALAENCSVHRKGTRRGTAAEE